MNNIILSIITPHYNSLDTLGNLITSIPQRDDIELVISDDGSDVSLAEIEEHIKPYTDGRTVRVIKNNTGVKGPGGARNEGMSAARGEWILFADADDSFVGDWFPKVSKYFDSDADIVYFCPRGIVADTNMPSTRHMRYVDVVTKCADNPTLKNETEMKFSFCTPWSKLFRVSIAKDNGLKFGDMMVSEDVFFTVQFAKAAKHVIADKNEIYCVTRRSGTLSSQKKESDYDTRVDVFIWRYNYLKDNLPPKEFKYTNSEWLALSRLVDSIFDGWGLKKFLSVAKKYRQNGVHVFNTALFNPASMIRNLEIEFKVWREINTKRK